MFTDSMIDFTHTNLPAVLEAGVLAAHDLIAIYDTGSPGIRETVADAHELAGYTIVWIDQAGNGSPISDATVRDVESGAWTVAEAVDRSNWHAPRPTIYISEGRLGELVVAGWDGDVWVAHWTGVAPASPPPLPTGAKFRIVAEQYANRGTYDISEVFDITWPDIPVPTTTPTTTPTNWQEIAMQALPVIQQGATGEPVRTIQGLCCARGHATAIDGNFGPLTATAVRLTQRAAGILVDAKVGPETWPVLLGIQ